MTVNELNEIAGKTRNVMWRVIPLLVWLRNLWIKLDTLCVCTLIMNIGICQTHLLLYMQF